MASAVSFGTVSPLGTDAVSRMLGKHLEKRVVAAIFRAGDGAVRISSEAAILTDDRVIECAVSGVPDDALGTRLVAHVVGRDALDVKNVLRICQEHVPRYMVPDHVEFLPALPKTSTDKIDRAGLTRRARKDHPQ